MSWWLLVLVLVAVAFLSGMVRGRLALGQGRTKAALPEGGPVNPLQMRVRGLDVAIGEVRDAMQMMPASTAQQCAITAVSRRPPRKTSVSTGDEDGLSRWGGPQSRVSTDTGPGTAVFERLLERIAEIDDADRRELADVGLDPGKIITALMTRAQPQLWERELSKTLESMQAGLRRIPTRRYG